MYVSFAYSIDSKVLFAELGTKYWLNIGLLSFYGWCQVDVM